MKPIETLINRKGARRMGEIPAEVLLLLNSGKLETKNLVEWLAIDVRQLAAACDLTCPDDVARQKIMGQNRGMGRVVLAQNAMERLADHPSDMVRAWVAYAYGAMDGVSFPDKLARIKPFAADHNQATRECAWDAWRSDFARDVVGNISCLVPWVTDSDANIRRCAIEGTRPRGVWTHHIDVLKQSPELALPLLEPVRSDPSRYVQNALGNWLNDAGKTQPKWVMTLTERWLSESPTRETRYIVNRARRSF